MPIENLLIRAENAVRKAADRLRTAAPRPARRDLNRQHFRETEHPLELACADELDRFPQEERNMLILCHGLSGHDPMEPARIAGMAQISLMQCLTIGEGAELRLRNSARCRRAFRALLDDSEPQLLGLADRLYDMHLEGAPPRARQDAMQAWLDALPPIRRLAVARAHEDGLGHALKEALLRRQARLEQHRHDERVAA